MHMVNRAFVNTGFLSTWVFGLQELEEQRNAKKHGQNKEKPYESVYSQNVILALMHLVLFSCIGFWKVGPSGCFASFLSTKCMNNWVCRWSSWGRGGCRRCGGRSEESVDGVQCTTLLWWIVLSLEQLRWAVRCQGWSSTRQTSSISSGILIASPIDDVKWM